MLRQKIKRKNRTAPKWVDIIRRAERRFPYNKADTAAVARGSYICRGRAAGVPVTPPPDQAIAASPDAGIKRLKDKDLPASADIGDGSHGAIKRRPEAAAARRRTARREKYNGPVPLLALIVDDGGGQMEYARRVAALDLRSRAIIPYQRNSRDP
ncbi:MAG: hypothetical protein ACLUEQ_13710 [Cloacibacillus evryensis]